MVMMLKTSYGQVIWASIKIKANPQKLSEVMAIIK